MNAEFDALSKYLIILGALLLLDRHFRIFGLIVVIYAIWRGFSKNKYKRQQELMVFESLIYSARQKFYRLSAKIKASVNYKVFNCPNCFQKLRVPRRKGNITITCSRCGTKFKGKS